MPKIKSHKTVEQIAKKHRLDVSFIQKQLDMGEPIEHEHTKDHELARDIALQHLDEIPDYYTRLKKMEADAKKHHKKFKDVKISEDLRNWFSKSHPEGNWRRFNSKGEYIGPCAREPGESKPKCLSNEKAAKMSKDEIAAAVRRKREKDPVANRKGKGGKPIMSSNKIEEGLLSKAVDRLKGRKEIGRTASGGKVYVSTGSKPSNVKYAGKTQDEIKSERKQQEVDARRKEQVKNGKYDDPWLKSSPAAERRLHYQQLRGESVSERRFCIKCKKMETRDECSYGPEMWDKMTIANVKEAVKNKDHEYSMARSELSTIEKAAKRLKKKVGKGEGGIEAWVQSKITKAADYLDSAADYVDSGEHNVDESITIEDLNGNTFAEIVDVIGPNEMEPIVDEDCWKGYRQVGMKKKGKKIVPNCVPEELDLEEENKPTNPDLWSKAKSLAKQKFDVYPSAYANGWASKWYKSKGGGWKSVSEEVELEEATRLQAENGNIIAVILSWRGKTYSARMFFPQPNLPTKKDVTDEIQKVYPGSQVLQYNVSSLLSNMPLIQVVNSRSKNYLLINKTIGEGLEEDWQSVNRKDKTDGLSQKAVKAYRRENPGSKLQTAVTEKNPSGKRADRRKSFCSRMSGMKKRLTSAETARDPDSRINKALRRWNCN